MSATYYAIHNPQVFPKGPVAIYLKGWTQPSQGLLDTGSKLTLVPMSIKVRANGGR